MFGDVSDFSVTEYKVNGSISNATVLGGVATVWSNTGGSRMGTRRSGRLMQSAPPQVLTPTDSPVSDPLWWRQAVVYQIYPRSFADANGDGIGDLPGITRRIAYLEALGVDAIWLSPFYPSALADGGYDVADYRDVDPRIGTLDDFDGLVAARTPRASRSSSTSCPTTPPTSILVPGGLASPPGSAARERYIFRDGGGLDGAQPPSDWRSLLRRIGLDTVPTASGTATCSPPSSPTSTGTTPRCGRTS